MLHVKVLLITEPQEARWKYVKLPFDVFSAEINIRNMVVFSRKVCVCHDIGVIVWKNRNTRQPSTKLTFHHDHIDIYGTDWWLRQSFPFLQDPGDFTGWNPVIRFGTKRHQLPDRYTYRKDDSWYVSVL